MYRYPFRLLEVRQNMLRTRQYSEGDVYFCCYFLRESDTSVSLLVQSPPSYVTYLIPLASPRTVERIRDLAQTLTCKRCSVNLVVLVIIIFLFRDSRVSHFSLKAGTQDPSVLSYLFLQPMGDKASPSDPFVQTNTPLSPSHQASSCWDLCLLMCPPPREHLRKDTNSPQLSKINYNPSQSHGSRHSGVDAFLVVTKVLESLLRTTP